jgi:hypothetical protein
MSGIGGFQTLLKGSSNLTNTASVLEITSISLPELGVTDIDVSSMDSTDNFMEFIGGSVDPGLIDITLNYDPAVDADILAAVGDVNETWTITFPDNSTWATVGYVNKMGGGTSTMNDKIDRVLSIKCSGVPTQTTGA